MKKSVRTLTIEMTRRRGLTFEDGVCSVGRLEVFEEASAANTSARRGSREAVDDSKNGPTDRRYGHGSGGVRAQPKCAPQTCRLAPH